MNKYLFILGATVSFVAGGFIYIMKKMHDTNKKNDKELDDIFDALDADNDKIQLLKDQVEDLIYKIKLHEPETSIIEEFKQNEEEEVEDIPEIIMEPYLISEEDYHIDESMVQVELAFYTNDNIFATIEGDKLTNEEIEDRLGIFVSKMQMISQKKSEVFIRNERRLENYYITMVDERFDGDE